MLVLGDGRKIPGLDGTKAGVIYKKMGGYQYRDLTDMEKTLSIWCAEHMADTISVTGFTVSLQQEKAIREVGEAYLEFRPTDVIYFKVAYPVMAAYKADREYRRSLRK